MLFPASCDFTWNLVGFYTGHYCWSLPYNSKSRIRKKPMKSAESGNSHDGDISDIRQFSENFPHICVFGIPLKDRNVTWLIIFFSGDLLFDFLAVTIYLLVDAVSVNPEPESRKPRHLHAPVDTGLQNCSLNLRCCCLCFFLRYLYRSNMIE